MEFVDFFSGVISREKPVVASRYVSCFLILKLAYFVAKTNI